MWYGFLVANRSDRLDPEQLRRAVGSIRSHGAVAVLGAGLSATRYPMTDELPSLLWHAIDSAPEGLSELSARLGRTGRAKQILGTDPDLLAAGWQLARDYPEVRASFQRAFGQLDMDREPTVAHENLARMIHAGLVELVVSFNWDTALERAYKSMYGVPLLADGVRYAKPHGDAAHVEGEWVLPAEDGVIPESLQARMSELSAQRPRTLVVVGYSKSDEHVVELLLEPTEAAWPVVNIGPSASDGDALAGTAEVVTDALVLELGVEYEPRDWRWVTFEQVRDLSAALMGYRLGPHDVAACPELPAAGRVADRLATTKFALLSGDSGSGKSITAFQAAHKLNTRGWAVVELARPGVATIQTVRRFSSLPGPVLAVVDDAQALDGSVLTEFERAISHNHAVMLVSITRGSGREEELVSATTAVATLVRYCESNPDVVLPLVSDLDDRVGKSAFRESLQQRVDMAGKSDYPWQFMYVLSGGERRITVALERLSEDSAAPAVLFGVVACQQFLTLDAGVTADELVAEANQVGLSREQFSAGLEMLRSERLLIERQGRIRTTHLRLADRALTRLCQRPQEAVAQQLLGYMQAKLADPNQSLQGRLWVIGALAYMDALRFGNRSLLINADTARRLVIECLAAGPGRDRGLAAYLLWRMGHFGALDRNLAEEVAAVLPDWIRSVTAEEADGIRWLLSHLRSSEGDLHAQVAAEVDPESVAERLTEHVTLTTADAWAELVSELAYSKGVDRIAWAERFEAAVDTATLSQRLQDPDTHDMYGLPQLVDRLLSIAPRVGFAVFEATSSRLQAGLENDLATTSSQLVHWAFGMMTMLADVPEESLDERFEWAPMRRRVIDFLDSVNWEQAAASLEGRELHELYNLHLLTFWLGGLSNEAINRLTRAMSIEWLEQATAGHWQDVNSISEVLWGLGRGTDQTKASELLGRHYAEIQVFPGRLASTYPDFAVELIRNGRTVPLPVDQGLRWGECTEAINAIAELDSDAALAVVEASAEDVLIGLQLRQNNMTEHLTEFIEAVEAIASGRMTDLASRLDPAVVEPHWRNRISGSADEAGQTRALLTHAGCGSGPIADLANALLQEHQPPSPLGKGPRGRGAE